MAVYKSFDINTVTTVKPWGAREEQVIRDLIDTLVVDTIGGAKNTSGHLHDKLYTSGSVAAIQTDATGQIGIGIALPDGTLHVHTATAGTVDAPTGADDLVVENNGNAGISILSPDTDYSQIYFGSPSIPSAAFLQWNHDNDAYRLGTIKTGAEVIFLSGNATQAMVIDSSQNVTINDGSLTLDEEGINLNRSTGGGYINFQDGLGANNWRLTHENTDNILEIWSATLDGHLRMGKTSTPTQFCLDTSTGDVGIGLVPTGAAKLEISSTTDTLASFISTDANAKIVLTDSSSTQYVATQSSILSLGPNGSLATFAGNLNIDASGHVGIGVVSPDGPLHVHTATAGTVSISTSADDLIVENGANAGISILSPDANYSSVFFGSPSHGSGGAISWKFDDSNMLISVTTDSHIIFRYDDSTEAMRIDGTTGYVGIGTGASPSELLHIFKTADPKFEVEDQNSSLTLTVGSSAAIVESEDLDLILKAPAANTILCSTAKFFRLPVKTDTGDPSSPTDGDCYVNTQDNTVRCYADGAWRDLVTW